MRGACGAAALAFLLYGCAGMGEPECRNADWYDLGFRDAILGLRSQEIQYAEACARHGVTVDGARYGQGWREGKYEADYRNPEPIQ
jgi:hypothetical protein